ncbi:hypothetical protein KC640_00510, partial [Candidatus Dojkabacteria bacterium]|nr:hypothetical protein [Candidatus Dojkabacteria bacterium]
DGVYSNIITAFDTVQNAGTQKIAVIAVPDWGLSPNTASSFPDQIGRQRVSDALARLNSRINNYVTQNQGVYIDGNTLGSTLIDKLTPDGKLLIDGVEISMLTNGNDPHNFTLGDGIHSGTVAGGLIANLIMQEVGSPWNLNETPFTEVEMLTSAGLAAECYTCKTDIDQNGFADLSDFFLFTQDFLKASPANPRTDINGDGAVNLDDYSVVTSHFLTTCPV